MMKMALAVTAGLLLSLVGGLVPVAADGARSPKVAPVIIGCAPGSFSGFYLGGHAGLVGHRAHGLDQDQFADNGDEVAATSTSMGNGWLAGGQIGYNRQCGAAVMGVEVDWSWVDVDQTHRFSNDDGVRTATRTSSVDWLATFRARAGLAVDNMLLFVTGGLALADIEHSWARTAAFDPSQNISRTFTDTRLGWTVGAGFEWALSDRISWKSEALYVSFADKTESLIDGSLDTHRFTHNDELWVVRTGLNVKFGHDRRSEPVPLK